MSDKTFPVIPERRRDVPSRPHPLRIPWSVAELAYSGYAAQYGRCQSLERIAERGGFHASEMDEYVPDWRERASEIDDLRTSIRRALGSHHNPAMSLAENVAAVVREPRIEWFRTADCVPKKEKESAFLSAHVLFVVDGKLFSGTFHTVNGYFYDNKPLGGIYPSPVSQPKDCSDNPMPELWAYLELRKDRPHDP